MTIPRATRPRVPVGPRLYCGRWSRTMCVATTLAFDEVNELDRAAGSSGGTRAEWIREAILQRLVREGRKA